MTEFVAEASQARFELTTYSLGGCRRVNGYYSDLSNVELTVSVSVDMDAFIPTYSARGDNSHGGCPKYFYACHFIRLFAQTQGKIRYNDERFPHVLLIAEQRYGLGEYPFRLFQTKSFSEFMQSLQRRKPKTG